MTTIGQRIKVRREELGLTQGELAQKLGYKSKSTINKIELGINQITQDKINRFAKALDCSVSYLMGLDDSDGTFSVSHKGKKKIPVLGHVAAGVPIEMLDNVIGYTLYDDDPDGDYFGLVIRGDSMEPRMFDGDIVVVKKQPDVESGQIAVVAVNGNEATCKRVMVSEDGITLVSLNSKYMPKFYTNKEVRGKPVTIIGKVVQVTGKIN